jgi:hypothetical protein
LPSSPNAPDPNQQPTLGIGSDKEHAALSWGGAASAWQLKFQALDAGQAQADDQCMKNCDIDPHAVSLDNPERCRVIKPRH